MVRIVRLITVYPHHEPTPQTESSFDVYIFLVVIGHAILLHSLCKVQNKVAGIACMIKLMYLHEVCGSRLAV